jgi:hypothetical protein
MKEDRHYGGYRYRNKRNKSTHLRNSFWGTVISAIAGTVVKDLTSDNSKLKKLINKAIHPRQIEDEHNEKKIIDGEYIIITDKNNSEQNLIIDKEKKQGEKDE